MNNKFKEYEILSRNLIEQLSFSDPNITDFNEIEDLINRLKVIQSEIRGEEKRSYIHIEKLIKKFKNGQALYNKNAVFRNLIHYMSNGLSIYDALEEVININENILKEYENVLKINKNGI